MIKSIIAALVLITLAALAIEPAHEWLPVKVHTLGAVVFLAAYAAYILLLFRERAGDERDVYHRMLASRAAYLTGATLLIVGIFIDGLSDAVDPFLVVVLVAMVIAKLATRIYCEYHR